MLVIQILSVMITIVLSPIIYYANKYKAKQEHDKYWNKRNETVKNIYDNINSKNKHRYRLLEKGGRYYIG